MKFLRPLLSAFALLALPMLRAENQPPPAGGLSLLAGDAFHAFTLQTLPGGADATGLSVVDVAGPGFSRAFRVETKREITPMAAIELRASNARAVSEGEVGYIRFYARTLSSADETGAGRIFIVVRRLGVDFNSSFELGVTFGSEWREFLFPFKFHKDFPAGDAALMLRFGFKRQTVEVGGVEFLTYGKNTPLDSLPRTRFSYAGREPDAAWRKAAQERIERIRKGDFSVVVRDASGKPVRDAVVRIEEKRSAFQFGSALQFSRLVHDSPENLIYREKALELFNEASPENDLKWVTWVGDWGPEYSPQQSVAGLCWLRAHDFYIRGHVLVWPGWKNLPKFVQDLNGTDRQKEIPGIVRAHIHDMADATRGLVDEWDTLNEPLTNHDLMDLFGRDIMIDWFKTAREAMPGVPLFFNDFSNQDMSTDRAHVQHFDDTTAFLLAGGAPVGGLGLQAHIGAQPSDPEEVLKVLDRYAKFKLPVRVTEFDIWTDDEQLQADYTRDFLTLMFSHPSVVGVQLWGFWEKAHWRPLGAMYRADWSEKPNAKVYRSLVLDQWRTRLSGNTDGDGRYSGRGFHGDYTVIIESAGKRVEQNFVLKPDGGPLTVSLTLP